MSNFVNIAPDDKTPLIINAQTLTMLLNHATLDEAGNKTGEDLAFFSTCYKGDGPFLKIKEIEWNVDAKTAYSKLSTAGFDLFKMPHNWSEDKSLGDAYFNPEAVSTVITSAPYTRDGQTEPYISVLIDIDAYGRFESCNVPAKLVDDLLDHIKKTRPDVMRVEPTEARARFSAPGYIVFDPKRISGLFTSSSEINVLFKNGGSIDFRLPLPDKAEWDFYLENPQISESLTKVFVERVAAKSDDLVKIDTSTRFYTTLDDIAWMYQDKNTIYFHYNHTDSFYKRLSVNFDTEDKAKAELKRIITLMPPKP